MLVRTVIERNESQLAAVHASTTICAFQAGEDTPLHVFAEVSGVNPVLDTSQLHRARAKSRS